jgi:two-component system, chemotaxis family, sensor kinase CheA
MDSLDLSQFKDMFLDEAQGYVQTLNASLLAMEQNPGDAGQVDDMFRAAHSLKGSAATMGYVPLAELAHGVEDVLHQLRERRWFLAPSLANLLFSTIDQLQSLLEAVAADREIDVDIAVTLEKLHGYTPNADIPPALPHEPEPELSEGTMEGENAGTDTLPDQPISIDTLKATGQIEQTRMIRVDVHHLDALLNIVTEMVIHRSLLDRLARRYKLPALNEALDVHQRHLEQLRDAVLEMRMVPLSQIFDRYPRMVRDLLKAQQKTAQLVVEGAEVEMDRLALEALSEPLVHLLRNAVDHGLEPPARRVEMGKTASGTLRLSAWRERDAVIIEVSDDGQGMNVLEIAAAAVERRLLTAEEAGKMTEEEVLTLICQPGFSLSKEVTAVSGRGVGMNVVKRQVERLRGSLTIMTRAGQGTSFRLQVPIKLSLMPAVLVQVGSETYAWPMTNIEQIIEFDPQQIERLADREILAVAGDVLPLCRLDRLLDVPDADPEPRYALLVHHNEHRLGLRVDAIEGHEEVVVKALPNPIRDIPGLSGITILGEGRTVLILDENLSQIGGL